MVKRNKLLLFFIVLLTLFSIWIDTPSIPVHFHFQKIKIDKTITPPNIDWNIGGTKIKKIFTTQLGLDLKGGSELVLQADMKKIKQADRIQALDSAKTVIENRVNLYGVSEPTIYTEITGNVYKIVVDLAGVKDLNQAKSLIGKTANLSFYTLRPGVSQAQSFNDLVGTNITGGDLTGATIVYSQTSTSPEIQLLFKAEGLKKFSDVARANVGKPVYVMLDNKVISAPTINQELAAGVVNNPVIQGNFTLNEAKSLVTSLDAGALPIPITIIQENTVSATLGQSSVVASLVAAIIGISLVLLFMIWNYKVLGLFADLALIIYTILTFAIYKTIPITLTLAGIAGFILSIGMAVDANILIFERTKEELQKGKTKTIAIALGFRRAWPSIRDSNISSLITTAILYTFGTSIIKGFAITLAIGVLVSLFTAVVVTRTLLSFLRNKKIPKMNEL